MRFYSIRASNLPARRFRIGFYGWNNRCVGIDLRIGRHYAAAWLLPDAKPWREEPVNVGICAGKCVFKRGPTFDAAQTYEVVGAKWYAGWQLTPAESDAMIADGRAVRFA